MIMGNLSEAGILENLRCDTGECLCFIIVLLNILTMFYLVFCSFYKVTRPVRIAGWVWCALDLTATVGILSCHTCIFTLLSTVFTALVLMAVLAVILPSVIPVRDTRTDGVHRYGSYVIYGCDGTHFCFALYAGRKRLLARSAMCYTGIESAKAGIAICRENGAGAPAQNLTESWILEVCHPRFELCKENGKYSFRLMINDGYMILRSESFDDVAQCLKILKMTQKAVGNNRVYFARDEIIPCDRMPVDQVVCREEPQTCPETAEPIEKPNMEVMPEPTPEPVPEPLTESQINAAEVDEVSVRSIEIAATIPAEDNVPGGVEVIGVIWPKDAGRNDRVYRYDPNGEKLQVGDVILVPTLDTERVVGVARANHLVATETITHPLKKIIRVVRRNTDAQIH